MLTEGWDANTVTHIMGLRAFGSQLLCASRSQAVPFVASATSSSRMTRSTGEKLTEKQAKARAAKNMPLEVPARIRADQSVCPSCRSKVAVAAIPNHPTRKGGMCAVEDRGATCEISFPNVLGYPSRAPRRRTLP